MSQVFIGTKIVKAWPMTRLQYNEYRHWALPPDENGEDHGYLVEYTDGGTPNDARHAGYISWSPKEQFDKAYLSVPASERHEDWFVRLLAERAQLADRLAKLDAFLTNNGGGAQLHRMQQVAMRALLQILDYRIAEGR